jgi:DUF438 domain-containing protein
MEKETSALLREILARAEAGESPSSLAEAYQKEFAELDESDLALAEGELISAGEDPAKLSRLCDVHAAVYLAQKKKQEEGNTKAEVTTPLRVLAAENVGIESALAFMKTILQEEMNPSLESCLFQSLRYLAPLGDHYSQKETLFFPYLIRHGVNAPVHVMWGVDDEIRGKLRTLLSYPTPKALAGHLPEIASFVEQAESMRTKEEKILIPLLEQQLTPADFEAIAREMPSQGYAFLSKGPRLEDFGLRKNRGTKGMSGFPSRASSSPSSIKTANSATLTKARKPRLSARKPNSTRMSKIAILSGLFPPCGKSWRNSPAAKRKSWISPSKRKANPFSTVTSGSTMRMATTLVASKSHENSIKKRHK